MSRGHVTSEWSGRWGVALVFFSYFHSRVPFRTVHVVQSISRVVNCMFVFYEVVQKASPYCHPSVTPHNLLVQLRTWRPRWLLVATPVVLVFCPCRTVRPQPVFSPNCPTLKQNFPTYSRRPRATTRGFALPLRNGARCYLRVPCPQGCVRVRC